MITNFSRIALILLFLSSSAAWSQNPRIEISEEDMTPQTMQVMLNGLPASAESARQLSNRMAEYELRRIQFDTFMLQHTENAFSWQAIASWLMMGLSVLLVLSGIAMSAYQFIVVAAQAETRAARAAADAAVLRSQATATASAAAAIAGQQPPLPLDFGGSTKLEISPTAIRVESGALGIIILVISLGFTYLFLDKVYELKPLLNEAQSPPAAPAAPGKPAPAAGK